MVPVIWHPASPWGVLGREGNFYQAASLLMPPGGALRVSDRGGGSYGVTPVRRSNFSVPQCRGSALFLFLFLGNCGGFGEGSNLILEIGLGLGLGLACRKLALFRDQVRPEVRVPVSEDFGRRLKKNAQTRPNFSLTWSEMSLNFSLINPRKWEPDGNLTLYPIHNSNFPRRSDPGHSIQPPPDQSWPHMLGGKQREAAFFTIPFLHAPFFNCILTNTYVVVEISRGSIFGGSNFFAHFSLLFFCNEQTFNKRIQRKQPKVCKWCLVHKSFTQFAHSKLFFSSKGVFNLFLPTISVLLSNRLLS